MTMTRQRKAYQSAAFRRRLSPVVWDLDGEEVFFKEKIDLLELAPLLDALREGVNLDGLDAMDKMRAVSEKQGVLRDLIKEFVRGDSVEKWEKVGPDFDVQQLVEMVNDLVAEYTGVDPTKLSSSAPGLPTDGESSEAGAAVEASTPTPSNAPEDLTPSSTPSESTPAT